MMSADTLIGLNPFPGLRPFASSETDRFFGRRQQIEEVAARLEEVRFVAVTGSSGCGKSSLVRAGILGELTRQRESGREWRAAVMRPGNRPIANLAEQLAPLLNPARTADATSAGALYGRLCLGGLGLSEAVRQARLGPGVRVLVVVDQFEELFRFQRMTNADEASAFVKLLIHASSDPDSPVSVVITLRSNTLGFCADFQGLPEMINRGQYLVPKLRREQRKEAIVNPVILRGFEIAPRLVQRVLSDVSDNYDDLPVMQHALMRTWNQWAESCQGSRPIDLDDYDKIGTAKSALSDHANEACRSLPELEWVVQSVFCALTERISGDAEERRPLEFERLCQVVGAGRLQVERVVERYRRPDTGFLMPSQDVPLDGNPVIDISHESLIRQWKELRDWTRAEAESRSIMVRLAEAAQRYAAKQGSLLQGPDLDKGLEWWRQAKPTPARIELYTGGNGADTWKSVESFLQRSVEETQRFELRWKVLVWSARGLIAVVAAVAMLAGISGYRQQKRTMSRELTNRALLEMDREPARSAHLALVAVELDAANARAEYALRQALTNLEVAHTEKILAHGAPVADARYTRDGRRLVTASGNTVTIFDSMTLEQVGKRLERNNIITNAWLISDNSILVTQTMDGRAQIEKVGDSEILELSCPAGPTEKETNPVYTVTVSPAENYVATGCYNGEILVWDVTSAGTPRDKFTRDVRGVTVTAMSFSDDGAYLASGDADGAVNLWKHGNSKAWVDWPTADSVKKWTAHSDVIRAVAFHPEDSGVLVTASDDSQAIVWEVNLERRRVMNQWPLKHERGVVLSKFALRQDERRQLFTVSDKTVRFWVDPNLDPKQVRSHDDWINDANASADGELLVTASMDGTARIWSTRSGTPIAVLRGHTNYVNRAVIRPDGRQVATASSDGTVRIWRVDPPPRLLLAESHWVLNALFEPGARRIAVGEEGNARILDADHPSDDFAGSPKPLKVSFESLPHQFHDMSWSRDGKFLAGVRSVYGVRGSHTVVLWDAEHEREIKPRWLETAQEAVFSGGTDDLLTISGKGQIVLWATNGWDTQHLDELRPSSPEFGEGYSEASISPDGRWIAAISDNNPQSVALWKRDALSSGPRVLEGHKGGIRSIEFSHDSTRLLTASADRTAIIWQLESPGVVKVLRGGHTAALSYASFDPEGKRVVTASADNTIRLWNADTAEELAALRWHSEGVNQVQFSADGKWILSASDDGTVKLGQCAACSLTPKELRDRVWTRATLPENELKEIRSEGSIAKRYFRLPDFLFSSN